MLVAFPSQCDQFETGYIHRAEYDNNEEEDDENYSHFVHFFLQRPRVARLVRGWLKAVDCWYTIGLDQSSITVDDKPSSANSQQAGEDC